MADDTVTVFQISCIQFSDTDIVEDTHIANLAIGHDSILMRPDGICRPIIVFTAPCKNNDCEINPFVAVVIIGREVIA